MRFQIFIIIVILSFLIGCSNDEPSKPITNQAKTNTGNTLVNKPNNSIVETSKTPVATKTDDAESIAPVVTGFYEALKKKDEVGVKKFLSAEALKYLENEAKMEKKTWFIYLLESEEPLDEKREVRNQKISGDKAVAEMKGGSLGEWTPIAFVKENGEWKFASAEESLKLSNIPKTDINLPKNNANSNSAK